MTLSPTPAWRPARVADWPALRMLLECSEPCWITLIDRLESAAPFWHRFLWLLDDPESAETDLPPGLPFRPRRQSGGRRLHACFYLNDAGLAMFAASRADPATWQLPALLAKCHRRLHKLYCLIGLSAQVDALQAEWKRTPLARNDYQVMVRPGPERLMPRRRPGQWLVSGASGFNWRGLEIRRAGDADTEALLDLQCAYEQEEVLIANHQLNRAVTRRVLETSLRERCIYCASAGNLMVAKAGTNGCSWRYAQIGGVFTDPAWRRNGIGEHLMTAVMGDIFENGYGASLFVKLRNHPAISLYNKLGFDATDSLSIAYY